MSQDEKEDKLNESTYSNASSTYALTVETLKKALDLIPKTRRLIIFFTSFIETQILSGEMVDRLLNCKADEEGFIVPDKYRGRFDEYRGYYEERRPGLSFDRFDWRV